MNKRKATLRLEIEQLTTEVTLLRRRDAKLVQQNNNQVETIVSMRDEIESLTKQVSILQGRLINKAGQYRDAQDKCRGYEEQHRIRGEELSKLECRHKLLKNIHELVCKHRDKLLRYEEFYHMLRALSGVDISITTKKEEKA